MMMPEFKFMEYFRKLCIKKKYIYITHSVVFVQFHWLTQSRDIQNIQCTFSTEKKPAILFLYLKNN